MIRGTVFKILKSKPVYTLLYKLSYIAVILGMLSAYFICHFGQSNKFEENAVSPKVQIDTQVDFVYKNVQDIIQDFQNLENEHKQSYDLEFINDIKPVFPASKLKVLEYIKKQFENLQLPTHEQVFSVRKQGGQYTTGMNLIGLFNVNRSPNFECNLISFDYSDEQNNYENMSLVLSLIKMFKEKDIKYMSRNMIFVAYDGQYKKQGVAIKEFLNSYFDESQNFLRSGIIRQALNVDFKGNFDSVIYKVFGFNGRAPDQDYILNFNQLLIKLDLNYKYTEEITGPEQRLQEYVFQPFDKFVKKQNIEQYGFIKLRKFVNFSHFLNILKHTIYGYLDDAHSYMYQHGIMAVTLAGNGPAHKTSRAHVRYLKDVIKVIEGTNRVCQSLDEQLHAGSTLYFPVEKNYSLTVAKYVYPIIIVAVSLTIQQLYRIFQQRNYRLGLRVWLQMPIYVLNLFLMLAMPYIIQFILQKLGHSDFQLEGVYWEDLNDPVLNMFIEYLFVGYIAGFLVLNVIFEFIAMICCENYFKPYNDNDRVIFQFQVVVYTFLCAVYWLFYTVSFAFFIILVFPIPCLVMYRYVPQNKTSLVGWIRAILNWVVLYGLIQGSIFIIGDYDVLETIKISVINYSNGAFQGYLFLVSTLINSSLAFIKFYSM